MTGDDDGWYFGNRLYFEETDEDTDLLSRRFYVSETAKMVIPSALYDGVWLMKEVMESTFDR